MLEDLLGPIKGRKAEQRTSVGFRAEGRLTSGVGVIDNALLARGLLNDTPGNQSDGLPLSLPQKLAPSKRRGTKPGLRISNRLAEEEIVTQARLKGSSDL